MSDAAQRANEAPSTRPGGRSERVRRAVLDATAKLLLEDGFDSLTIPAVAREADVYPSTIYRRWNSKGELALDAVISLSAEGAPAPDTGSLRGDISALVHVVVGALRNDDFRELARTLIGLKGEIATEARQAYWQKRIEIVQQIIDQAVERCEIARPRDAWEIIEVATSTIWMRSLITELPVDDEFVERMVDRAVAYASSDASA